MPAATEPLALEIAQAQLLALATPLAIVSQPLGDAVGMVLARPLQALRDQPPADVSAMDGWAVRHTDLPGPLEVIGESAAGTPFAGTLHAGQAVRIFTGAHVPAGADCVAVQEEMASSGAQVSLVGDGPAGAGAHIRRRAQDMAAGSPLLAVGSRLGAAQIGLLAAGGHASLPVHRRPRVALLCTGNELVPVGTSPGPGQIISSNAPMLLALAQGAGAAVTDLGIARDDMATLKGALQSAAKTADVIVTIGGVSVGDHDLVRPALLQLGADIDFWRIAIRPGKPLLAGRLDDAIILGLPGNPVSAYVCAQLFLLPLLRCLMGDPDPLPALWPAVTTTALAANGPRRAFLRARAQWCDGRLVATASDRQDSSLLGVLAHSNALLVRPEHGPAIDAGDVVALMIPDTGLTCSAKFF